MDYLTVPDVARQLNMSSLFVRRLIQSHQLPAVKFGRVYRVSEKDLNDYIAAQRTTV